MNPQLKKVDSLGRIVHHDFALGDKVWAVVTPDGVPTRARLERFGAQLAGITSLRTGLSYSVAYDQLAKTQAEALEQSAPLPLSRVTRYLPNGYLIVEETDVDLPVVLNVCTDNLARNELFRQQVKHRPDANVYALDLVDGKSSLATQVA